MNKYRKPTKDEEISAWRALAWEINLHRTITMDNARVISCLSRIDSYVNAHRDGNGTVPDQEVNENVRRAFWEKIAEAPSELMTYNKGK